MSDTTCPRCGSAFHCGAGEAQPCACTGVRLPAATLDALRRRFDGCLCLRCLQSLQRGEAPAVAESTAWPPKP